MTKTIHFHWENRFVLQWYGAVRKLYQDFFIACYQEVEIVLVREIFDFDLQ